MTTQTLTEFGANIYNDRYKYGYNWSVYQNLGKKVIECMLMTGCQHKNIIDIGCGMGWFTDSIYFQLSTKVKGIDFSRNAIKFHGPRLFPQIDFEQANIYSYDYKGYDVFVLMEVLEHIKDDKALLRRIPKGGMVYATVPFEDMRRDITHLREYSSQTVTDRYGQILDIKAKMRIENFIFFWGVRK